MSDEALKALHNKLENWWMKTFKIGWTGADSYVHRLLTQSYNLGKEELLNKMKSVGMNRLIELEEKKKVEELKEEIDRILKNPTRAECSFGVTHVLPNLKKKIDQIFSKSKERSLSTLRVGRN